MAGLWTELSYFIYQTKDKITVAVPIFLSHLMWSLLLSLVLSDINELNLPKTCEINFPDDDDLLNFRLIISPDEVCLFVCLCVRERDGPVFVWLVPSFSLG